MVVILSNYEKLSNSWLRHGHVDSTGMREAFGPAERLALAIQAMLRATTLSFAPLPKLRHLPGCDDHQAGAESALQTGKISCTAAAGSSRRVLLYLQLVVQDTTSGGKVPFQHSTSSCGIYRFPEALQNDVVLTPAILRCGDREIY